MNKIPVGQTVAFAYRFTFGHIGTVIGLIWIPLVVLYVLQFFLMNEYTQAMQEIAGGINPAQAGPLLLKLFGFVFVVILLLSVAGSALTRQALGLRTGPAMIYFSLGAPEFNLFLSFLAAVLVIAAIYIAIVIGAIVIGGAAGAAIAASGSGGLPAKVALGLVVLAVMLIALCVLLYVSARLTFLIAPVTVTENKIDLIRAWQLTKGNFWRIFVVGLAVLGPPMIVAILGQAAILGPAYFAQSFVAPGNAAANAARLQAQMQMLASHQAYLLGLGMLLAPFVYGLMFAAPAFAYQKLTGPAQTALNAEPMKPA